MLQAVKLGVDFTSSTSVAIADTTFVISMRRRQDDYCSDGVAEEMPPDKKIFCLSRSHFGKVIVRVIVVATRRAGFDDPSQLSSTLSGVEIPF